jgi:uncharacterized protein YndB with AHSA1/START domain
METIEVNVSVCVPPKPEQVFDAWLDPNASDGPWRGDGGRCLNPVVGGLFYWSDRHWSDQDGDREWGHYGRFLAIERPSRIAFTWMAEATRGLESVVTLTLIAFESGTRIELRHAGLPDDQAGHAHENAWARILEAMGAES